MTHDSGKTHILKIWPEPFQAVLNGTKLFEIRRHDRHYAVHDTLLRKEWDPASHCFTGRHCTQHISYLSDFEQQPGWIVLGLSPARAVAQAQQELWAEVAKQLDEHLNERIFLDCRKAIAEFQAVCARHAAGRPPHT